MKLIQKIAFCATLALMGSASASTLFWQVNTKDDAGTLGYAGNEATYAVLYATKAGDTTENVVAGYNLNEGKAWATDLDKYGSSEYSFFVELLNSSGTPVYKQSAVSYDNLVSSGYVSSSPLSVPTAALSGGFNGAAVPEPTSGILLLVGGALLALRRRRA